MTSESRKTLLFIILLFIVVTDLSVILDVPVLRQVFGFILLTFLPGFLIVQTLRPTRNPLEKTLFLIGLSVSFLMFVPLLMNFIYPTLGISHPIAVLPLTTTFSLILAGLSLVAYRTGALDFQIATSDFRMLTARIRSPPILGAALIFILGILGALFIRYYYDSLFSLFSMLSIVVVVILVISRRVSARFYPLYILVIALALLYGRTLTSPNLPSGDILGELYFADLVRASGFWDPSFVTSNPFIGDYASLLSVVFLPNVYATVLNADTVWVYQLVIPFIFAFVPLALFQVYKTQIKFSDTSAFLAVFFFMALYIFYWQIPRQQVATLFLLLAVLLIVSSSSGGSKKTALLILFVASMVVSHYGLSYIFLFYLAVLLIGCSLIGAKKRQLRGKSAVSVIFVVLVLYITFGWNIFTAGGAPYSALIQIGKYFGTELFTSNVQPSVAGGIATGLSGGSFILVIAHVGMLAAAALLTIGLALSMRRGKARLVNTQFLLLSLASFAIGLVAIASPFVATSLNGTRLYGEMLLFLAPYFIIGIAAVVAIAASLIKADKDLQVKLKRGALIVVLIPYFLFSYGFIAEITEHPSNYAFLPSLEQRERVIEYSLSGQDWSYLVQAPIPTESVYAGKWLSGAMDHRPVYADGATLAEVIGYAHVSPDSVSYLTFSNLNQSFKHAYVYLGAANVQSGSIAIRVYPVTNVERPISSYRALTAGNRVYSNGLAQVYYYT